MTGLMKMISLNAKMVGWLELIKVEGKGIMLKKQRYNRNCCPQNGA